MRRWVNVCGTRNFHFWIKQMPATNYMFSAIQQLHAALPCQKQSKTLIDEAKKKNLDSGQLPPLGSRIMRVPTEKAPIARQGSYGIIRTTRAFELRRMKQTEPVQFPSVKLSPYLSKPPKNQKLKEETKEKLPSIVPPEPLKRSNTFVVCKGKKSDPDLEETPVCDTNGKCNSSSFIPIARIRRQVTVVPKFGKNSGSTRFDVARDDANAESKKSAVNNNPNSKLPRKARMRI